MTVTQSFFNASEDLMAVGVEVLAATDMNPVVATVGGFEDQQIEVGMGPRLIMNFYFLVQQVPENYDFSFVKRGVEDIWLTKLASWLMWMLNRIFGMSMIHMPWMLNERDGKFLLQGVLSSGNFVRANVKMQGVTSNLLKRAWVVSVNAFRYWRFNHWACFWSPLWRVYHFVWKRLEGFRK